MQKFLIINHANKASGSANYFEDYLLRKADTAWRLSHPLDAYEGGHSVFFKNRERIHSLKRRHRGAINFIEDFVISLKYISKMNFDIFIGANNFDTLAGVFARSILRKKIRTIIFFASDFSEDRFKSSFLNWLYILVEKTVLKKADIVISNTYRAQHRRMELGLNKLKSYIIPNGIYIKDPAFQKKDISKQNFIYVGSITKEHGLYNLISVMYPLIDKLVIIGQGDDLERVEQLCRDEAIKYEPYQYMTNDYVLDYLKNFNGFGLAPYNLESKWTYYSSPNKVGEYMASGIPVIISNIPEISSYIQNEKLGITYTELDVATIKEKIDGFDVHNFHLKAAQFYEEFNRDKLYGKLIFLND